MASVPEEILCSKLTLSAATGLNSRVLGLLGQYARRTRTSEVGEVGERGEDDVIKEQDEEIDE